MTTKSFCLPVFTSAAQEYGYYDRNDRQCCNEDHIYHRPCFKSHTSILVKSALRTINNGMCDEDSLMRLTSTIETRRAGRKIIRCEYQQSRLQTLALLNLQSEITRPANDASIHPTIQPHFLIRSNTGRSKSAFQDRVNVSSFKSGAV